MNVLRKVTKSSVSSVDEEWNASGSFVRKPVRGWIHPDHQLKNNGITYEMRYVGAAVILESVRTIPFDQRGGLIRESIAKCCLKSNLFNFKPRKVTYTHGLLGDVILTNSGVEAATKFSTSFIKTYAVKNGEVLWRHMIENVSFASIGEREYKTMVGYISKDKKLNRACFVFQCQNGLADDIILTIGQAFELKYKEYLSSSPTIQTVFSRFTDPKSNEISSEVTFFLSDKPLVSKEEFEETGVKETDRYSHLFDGANVIKNTESSTSNYDNLKYNNHAVVSNDLTESINCMHMSTNGSDFDFDTVYDNPIEFMKNKELEKDNTIGIGSRYNNPDKIPVDASQGYATLKIDFEKGSEYIQPIIVQSESKLDETDKVSVPPIPKPRPKSQSKFQKISADTTLHNSKSVAKELNQETWFHGPISRTQAEDLLDKDGDFLIRESTTSPGQYVLVGMKNGVPRHLLLVDPNGYIRTKDRAFESVSELVNYYQLNNGSLCGGEKGVQLNNEIIKTKREYSMV